MDHDPYANLFRYQRKQCVHWAEYPDTRYYIRQRRWTQREILAPVVEYRVGLTRTGNFGPTADWIRETDLMAWEASDDGA